MTQQQGPCMTCRFWDKGLLHMDPDGNTRNYHDGTCHRYPRYESKNSFDWCGEHQPTLTNATPTLSDGELARLWTLHRRHPGWTINAVTASIPAVRDTIAAGATTEADVCRVLRCRKNTVRWRAVAEIRARLMGEWPAPSVATMIEVQPDQQKANP